jgi:putative molybdopterin biosynthesis protein
MGARCIRYPIVPDEPSLIADALETAARKSDLVIISAGSSAGTRDFTADVISSLGELLFHGVAVRPGKPVMLGRIFGKPVLGLPGYPLAAQTMLREFAAPLLENWGLAAPHRHTVRVRLASSLSSEIGFDEFIPLFVGRIGNSCWGTPHIRGAGVQMATVKANAFVHLPARDEGYETGYELDAVLTTDPGSIDRTVILSGSLDPVLEELANLVHDRGLYIHASATGNIRALLALENRSCHMASLTLPALSLLAKCRFLTQRLPTEGLVLVHIAAIEQGIASRDPVTPDDLPGIRWINSPKDSSMRVIFDNLLRERGLQPSQIDGYLHEVTGSQAAAAAVRNGFADAGMCTSGVARASGLLFMPVALEHFELAFNYELLGDERISTIISLVNSREFRKVLDDAGGYDTRMTGTIRHLASDCTVTDLRGTSTTPV